MTVLILQQVFKTPDSKAKPFTSTFINAFLQAFKYFANMFGASHNNTHSSISPTSWLPIGNSQSYDLWELPHPASRVFEDEVRDQPDPSSPSVLFDFEHQILSPLLSSWSFTTSFSHQSHDQNHFSPRHSNNNNNIPMAVTSRQRLDSDSQSSTHTSSSTHQRGNQPISKKQTLGDATNTAPVLRVSRSRFL